MHQSGLSLHAPQAHSIVHVPMDGKEAIVSVTANGYVYLVKLWGTWYFAGEVLSAQMLAHLQQAYEEME